MRSFIALASLSLFALILSGCSHGEAAAQIASAPPPQVNVATVVSKPITEFVEFTARFEPVERVQIRPRVSGYISSINFTQGREVKKGEVLVVIDPRPYQAELKRAQAQLAQARSQQELAKSERDRAVRLLSSHAISREDYDSRIAATEQASANVDADAAAVDSAALNLEFTRVTAPISGLVGRAEVTAGNLVTGGETLLATLVSIDPIYVSFDSDEEAYLKYLELGRGSNSESRQPVFVGLADEAGYPHQGVMVFVNNEIEASTGTIRARGSLENHDHQFLPGMFARVKLPGATAHDGVLINDSAVGTDLSAKYVLVVGTGNRAEYRPVRLGPIVDGLRVVREGLSAGETIVVNGLQRVRPGAVVSPERVAMGERPAQAQSRRGGLLAHNDKQ